jgi:cation diffusion facilitator family transporter
MSKDVSGTAGVRSATGRSRAPQAAAIALLVTVALAAAKVLVWLASDSLAVLSQALDSVVDILALALVFVAVRVAAKPADATHHYGHAKAENLVAFVHTLLLAVTVAAVALEAVRRLAVQPRPVSAPAFAVALMGGSVVVDVLRVRYLRVTAEAEGSDALRAGALNLAGDIGTAVVALASLLAVRAGVERADAVGALVVALAVAAAGVRLGKRSVDVLMDRAPGARVEVIAQAATGAAGVAETRRVRVRGGDKQLFADVTVAAGRTSSLERAHDIAESVEREIERAVPGTDVVVHVEPIAETSGLVERVQAAASRTAGVHEVHNVAVHALDEPATGLRVTLHAKATAGASLAQAHELSDAIERSVRDELGPGVRVDTHIEPLEHTSWGRDVTSARSDVVAAVRRFALREPEVIDCHEVVVTSTGDEISVVAHVRGRADLPLARMHAASTRIENAVHAAFAEVGPVLIHFEPLGASGEANLAGPK